MRLVLVNFFLIAFLSVCNGHDVIVYKETLYFKDADNHKLEYNSKVLCILEKQTWGELTKFLTAGSLVKVNPGNFYVLHNDTATPVINMSSTDGLKVAEAIEKSEPKKHYKYLEITKNTDKIDVKNSFRKNDQVLIYIGPRTKAAKVATLLSRLNKAKVQYLTIDEKLKFQYKNGKPNTSKKR